MRHSFIEGWQGRVDRQRHANDGHEHQDIKHSGDRSREGGRQQLVSRHGKQPSASTLQVQRWLDECLHEMSSDDGAIDRRSMKGFIVSIPNLNLLPQTRGFRLHRPNQGSKPVCTKLELCELSAVLRSSGKVSAES